jgi:hypothetical protein
VHQVDAEVDPAHSLSDDAADESVSYDARATEGAPRVDATEEHRTRRDFHAPFAGSRLLDLHPQLVVLEAPQAIVGCGAQSELNARGERHGDRGSQGLGVRQATFQEGSDAIRQLALKGDLQPVHAPLQHERLCAEVVLPIALR